MTELKDMAITTIEIVPGLIIATRMNLTSMAKAEEKYNKPFSEITFTWTKDLIFLFKVLAEQASGGKVSESIVEELINDAIEKGIGIEAIGEKLEKVIGGGDSKNSQKLNRAQRRAKK